MQSNYSLQILVNSYEKFKFDFMRILLPTLMIVSLGMCFFNLIQIDWNYPLRDKSSIAVIGVIASASSFLLVLILFISKKIAHKLKNK